MWVDQAIPNTDPNLGPYNTLTTTRVVYYEPPGQTVTAASGRVAQAATPLAVMVQTYDPLPGDYDEDGDVDPADFAAWPACMTGPDNGFVDPSCGAFDFDVDQDVDLADFAAFQSAFTGPL